MPSGFSPSVNASVKTTLSKSEPFTSAFLFLPALPIQYFFFAHFLIVAEVMQQLGLRHLVREPNVYTTVRRRCIHPMLRGWPPVHRSSRKQSTKLFKSIQKHVLLRPTGDLTVGNTISFLGRNICNKGDDYYEISLAHSYTTELLEEAGMSNCNPAPAPGNNTLTATSEMEQ